MTKYPDDFKIIKSEYERYGPEVGEGVASAMYEALVIKLAPYYFGKDDAYKRRTLDILDNGEQYVGTKNKFDWLNSFIKHKP